MDTLKKQTGATLIELAVVAVVLGILVTVLLGRLLHYQEVAEKTVMETTAINMRSGLKLRIAELMVQDRMQDLAAVAQENPINWLEAPPKNYLGELDDPAQHEIPPGSWYYDRNSRELVYLPDRARHLKPGPDGEKRIRYRVTHTTRPDQGSGQPVVEGVTLSLVVPYDWPVF